MDKYDLLFISTFDWIVYISLISSLIILLFLFIKSCIKNRLGIKFHYALWFLLILRLVIPLFPQSRISIFNLTPIVNEKPGNYYIVYNSLNDTVNRNIYESLNSIEMSYSSVHHTQSMGQSIVAYIYTKINHRIITLSLYVWFTMFLFWVFILFMQYVSLSLRIKSGQPVKNNVILSIYNNCVSLVNIKKKIPVVYIRNLNSPAVFGILKPKILLPYGIEDKISLSNFKYIFLHELCHIKRRDMLVSYVSKLLTFIHWFNPLIWYAFYRMSMDRELYCDALALSFIPQSEVADYGLTLIDLSKTTYSIKGPAGVIALFNNKLQIKQRIMAIKCFSRQTIKFSFLSFSLLFLISIAILTDAKAKPLNEVESNTPYSSIRETDRIDQPFENDPETLGSWVTVDFISEIYAFNPEKKNYSGSFFLKNMKFESNGITNKHLVRWTKNYVINSYDLTASHYMIKKIKGDSYMFLEWKNWDNISLDEKPFYYVLKKIKDKN